MGEGEGEGEGDYVSWGHTILLWYFYHLTV